MWADYDYLYKYKITINPAQVAGDETDFPVLVSVTDNNLRDTANGGHVNNSNGYDIVFYNSTELTKLDHEIERYVNTTGILIYWVKIPSLSSTSNTIFYMYFGKNGVTVDPSTTNTWNASFQAVWHMDDATTTTIDDSTANGNDGTKVAVGRPLEANGKIGKCQDFDRNGSDYITLPDMGTAESYPFTFELWLNTDFNFEPGVDGTLINQENSSLSTQRVQLYFGAGVGTFWYNVRNVGAEVEIGGLAIHDGAWHYVAGVSATATNHKIYLAGGESASSINNVPNPPVDTQHMGRRLAGVYYDQYIDEVRISTTNRSGNWISTCHSNQNAPGTFMSFGPLEMKHGTITITGTLHFE